MESASLNRLLLVTAFALSAYSGVKRTCKPFNALLGETFELACPEKGFRFISEKARTHATRICENIQQTHTVLGHLV